jgi:uncharacterized membrane-anchored protein
MNNAALFAASTLLLLCSASFTVSAFAEQSSNPAQDPTAADAQASGSTSSYESEIQTAYQAAEKSRQSGPQNIPLAGQATLKLPEGFSFIPAPETRRLLESMGNSTDDSMLGMVMPLDPDADWFIVVSYEAAGYIKDDDAKSWNADDLLSNIREGTAETNKDRKARGIPEMEVVGWIEKPQYDSATRQLVWSLESRDVGQATDQINGINYNTLTLGREGYISMNLVTDVNAVESLKPTAKSLLADLSFDTGKRYSDFNASTDKVAEYGLAALVAGVAAKKLGLLALIAASIAKFWKLALIGFFAVGSFFRKFFKRS